MPVRLKPEITQALTESIKRYFTENLDDEIGDLQASLLLEFCLKEIGPSVYNQAIADARKFMAEKIDQLDTEFYETEG